MLNILNDSLKRTKSAMDKFREVGNILKEYDTLSKEFIKKYGYESSGIRLNSLMYEKISDEHKKELISNLKNLILISEKCIKILDK